MVCALVFNFYFHFWVINSRFFEYHVRNGVLLHNSMSTEEIGFFPLQKNCAHFPEDLQDFTRNLHFDFFRFFYLHIFEVLCSVLPLLYSTSPLALYSTSPRGHLPPRSPDGMRLPLLIVSTTHMFLGPPLHTTTPWSGATQEPYG